MFSHEFGQVHFLEQFLFLIKDHNEKIYTYAEKKKIKQEIESCFTLSP